MLTDINSLVVGSGGVRIFLLLGAIDYLFEKNILNNIKYYAGSSSGSIICLLLSIGYTPKEICAYMCSNDIISYLHNLNPILLAKEYGLVDINEMKIYLDEMCIKKIGYVPTFNDLYKNFNKFFVCTALNLNGKDKNDSFKYFSYLTDGDMEVTTAVCFSSNIPIVFTKTTYKNKY
jgi:predicted acylesterase/phospholipase RssA